MQAGDKIRFTQQVYGTLNWNEEFDVAIPAGAVCTILGLGELILVAKWDEPPNPEDSIVYRGSPSGNAFEKINEKK